MTDLPLRPRPVYRPRSRPRFRLQSRRLSRCRFRSPSRHATRNAHPSFLLPLLLGGLLLSACESHTSPFVWDLDEEEEHTPTEIGIREYEVLPLELPPGMEGVGTDLHASGRAVGYVRDGPDGLREGVRWEGVQLAGRWSVDGWHVVPAAVNGRGDVAATVRATAGHGCSYGAFLTPEQEIVRFTGPEPDPASEETCENLIVRDMDERGRVVGDYQWRRNWGFAYMDERMVRLIRDEEPGSPAAPEIRGMNDRGIAVGWVRPVMYHAPFIWNLEEVEADTEALPGAYFGSGWSRTGRAVGVNDAGRIMVTWGIQSSDSQSLFDLVTGERTDLYLAHADVSFLPSSLEFRDINERGEIVGHLGSALAEPLLLSPSADPFHVRDVDDAWLIEELVAIDDRGWILAQAIGRDDLRTRPVLLRPVEES